MYIRLHDSAALLLTHPQHLRQILLHLGFYLCVRILLLLLLRPSTTTLLVVHLRIRIAPLISLLLLVSVTPAPIAVPLVIPAPVLRRQMLRHDGRSPLQVDVHTARVRLRRVLQA